MDDPFIEISNRINQVFQDTGRDIVSDIKETIGESWPPASSPGQPPHLRSGDLQQGIDHLVNEDANRPTLDVTSEMFYSSILEFGSGGKGGAGIGKQRRAATRALQETSHPIHQNPEDPDEVAGHGMNLTGGGVQPRPFMEPAQDKWGPILVQRLQAKFS